MKGSIVVSWFGDPSSTPDIENAGDKEQTFEPNDEAGANGLFDTLKEQRWASNIRLMRVERFASIGG